MTVLQIYRQSLRMTPDFFAIFGQKPVAFTDSSAVVSETFAARNFGDPHARSGSNCDSSGESRLLKLLTVHITGARFPANAEIPSCRFQKPQTGRRTRP